MEFNDTKNGLVVSVDVLKFSDREMLKLTYIVRTEDTSRHLGYSILESYNHIDNLESLKEYVGKKCEIGLVYTLGKKNAKIVKLNEYNLV